MPDKRGHNKGILAARKIRKREEAEARNEKTLPERTRAFRRQQQSDGYVQEQERQQESFMD